MRKSLIFMAVSALFIMLMPGCTRGETGTAESDMELPGGEESNFRFWISDEENAIGDFSSLEIRISKIGLQSGGESGSWVEHEICSDWIDLVNLTGDKAQLIWEGVLEPGTYNKAFIYVNTCDSDPEAPAIQWDLIEDEPGIQVMLPSEKLQIQFGEPWEVTDGEQTNFTYDLTVIKAGQSGLYLIKPQIEQSGTDQQIIDVTPEDELTIQLANCETGDVIEGNILPDDQVKVLVTHGGEALEEAIVYIEGFDSMTTDEEGFTNCFTVPDEEEMEIAAESDGLEGEREFAIEQD